MRTRRCVALILVVAGWPCRAPAIATAPITLRIASLMIRPVKWDKAANRQRLERAIRKAKEQGAELIVTPEGALEGYVVNEVIQATGQKRQELTDRFNALAEPCNGPYVRHFQELSKELKVHLVLGFLEADQGKTHFAQGYRNGPNKGDNPPGYLRGTEYPVFALGEHRVGIMICYDRREPVVAQRLVQNGAELILNPSYGMMGDCNREFIAARAEENGVPILFVHPEQTVFSDTQGEIKLDVRPQADEPRLALLSVRIPTRIPTAPAGQKGLVSP
jgi:predicted amidohydrolase